MTKRIFIGTVTDGVKTCGIEYDEGTLTKEKWKIIEHAMDVYVKACEKLKAIEDLEQAEYERELFEMNQKAMEKIN